MKNVSPSLSPELLLTHSEWVRRLARGLVLEDRVEDVVQETWLEVLQRPPGHGAHPRAWLAAVVRNVARRLGRTESRRRRREQAAATVEAAAPITPQEMVEKAALHRRVVDAVLELPEPYRSTLLFRYFEDLEPADLASRDGVPLETVRTRLKRGRKLLREKLQRQAGDCTWFTLLIPLLDPQATAALSATLAAGTGASATGSALATAEGSPLFLGAFLMGTKALLVCVAVLVLGAGAAGLWLLTEEEPLRAGSSATIAMVPDPGESAATESTARATASTRDIESETESDAPTSYLPTEVSPKSCRLSGTVRDWNGRRVSGAQVALFDGEQDQLGSRVSSILQNLPRAIEPDAAFESRQLTATDADGFFVLEDVSPMLAGMLLVVAPDRGLKVLRGLELSLENPSWSVEVVLEAGVRLHGRISDASGSPVPGAVVSLSGKFGKWSSECARLKTDAAGRFESALLPNQEYSASIRADGFLRVSLGPVDVPPGATEHRLDVQLERTLLLRGRFLAADGGPALLRSNLAPLLGKTASGDEVLLRHLRLFLIPYDRAPVPNTPAMKYPQGRILLDADLFEFEVDSKEPGRLSLWWNETLLGEREVGSLQEDLVVDYSAIPDSPPTCQLLVKVQDEAGDPVLDYDILLWPSRRPPSGVPFGGVYKNVGAEGGRFLFPAVPPGHYKAEITPHGYAMEYHLFEVSSQQTTTTLTVTAHRPEASLHGVVQDAQGLPIPNAQIEVSHPDGRRAAPLRTYSNAEGRFAVPRLARGSYLVTACTEERVPQLGWASVTADPEGEVTIVIPETQKISLLPHSEQGGAYGQFKICIRNAKGQMIFDDSRTGTTRGGSHFNLRLPPGEYVAEILSPGFALLRKQFLAQPELEMEVTLIEER